MKETILSLAINPGSTSTKIAVYKGGAPVLEKNITYSAEELAGYKDGLEQMDMRTQGIEDVLRDAGIDSASFDIVISRGGALASHATGAYEVDDFMLNYVKNVATTLHAASTGAFIARRFAEKSGCRAIIYDGPRSNEMRPVARVTGLSGCYRWASVHVLNGRACVRKYAESIGKRLDELNAVVAHLGGGVSIAAYQKGVMVDAMGDQEGPLSPERAGRLSTEQLISYYAESGLTKMEMLGKLRGKGGMVALLGTNNAVEVEKRIASGDKKAETVYDTMCYQTAKCIGEMSVAMQCDVDVIILTGSIAHSERVTGKITEYVKKLAPVHVYPGQFEMEALSLGGLRVVTGEEQAKAYDQALLDSQFSL